MFYIVILRSNLVVTKNLAFTRSFFILVTILSLSLSRFRSISSTKKDRNATQKNNPTACHDKSENKHYSTLSF